MVTEKDLSVEQRMAVSMAIAGMERNFTRNSVAHLKPL